MRRKRCRKKEFAMQLECTHVEERWSGCNFLMFALAWLSLAGLPAKRLGDHVGRRRMRHEYRKLVLDE